MATLSWTLGAGSATLSGTTTDNVSLPGYEYLEVTNLDSTTFWIAIEQSVTNPASGTQGSIPVRANESVVVPNPSQSAVDNAGRYLRVKGNGEDYAVRGVTDQD